MHSRSSPLADSSRKRSSMSKNPGIHPTMSALRFRDNGLNQGAADSATVFGGVQLHNRACHTGCVCVENYSEFGRRTGLNFSTVYKMSELGFMASVLVPRGAFASKQASGQTTSQSM